MPANECWVYFLQIGRWGSIYVGVAKDPLARYSQHRRGKGATCTARFGTGDLLGAFCVSSRREALQLEHSLKHLTHAEKLKVAQMAASSSEWRNLMDARGNGDTG